MGALRIHAPTTISAHHARTRAAPRHVGHTDLAGSSRAARAIKVDPALFSNHFITTFVDASGLIIYFLIARAVLGI